MPCKDRFFYQLENNFSSYINDRSAAYDYITRELQAYDGKCHLFYCLTTVFVLDEALVTLHLLSQAK